MKITCIISLLMIMLFSGISCKNVTPEDVKQSNGTTAVPVVESQKSDAPYTNDGYLSCKVDGIPLQASLTGTVILFVPDKKEVNIWGKTPKGFITIIIDDVKSTGTYTIKGNSKNAAGIISDTKMYEVKETGTPFEVTIESIDKLNTINSAHAKAIRGTFRGKLMDQDGNMVEITEGKFSTQ